MYRSLDDTEVLRRKYVEAKQSYEEKVSNLFTVKSAL